MKLYVAIIVALSVAATFNYVVLDYFRDQHKKVVVLEESHIGMVNFYMSEKDLLTEKLEILETRISILEESVNPKENRWNRVKRIRDAVKSKIVSKYYPVHLSVNELTDYAAHVLDYSEQYDVDIALILAVTERESAFNPKATSPVGAKGLMQIMDETALECAKDLGKPHFNIFKTRDNVQLGVWYLAKMLHRFSGDVDAAIKAYNAGPTYVAKHLAKQNGFVDLPEETEKYHVIVKGLLSEYQNLNL